MRFRICPGPHSRTEFPQAPGVWPVPPGESPVLTKTLPLASTAGPPAPHIPALALVAVLSTPE